MSNSIDRERDPSGRPKNARPRDTLGRPMPRETGESFIEPALPTDQMALLAGGIEHFNAQRFFQAHEFWEAAWHAARDDEREFWQGITQIAVGFTHYQRGNANGSTTLLRRGSARLDAFGDTFLGVAITGLTHAARAAADAIELRGVHTAVTFPTI